MRLGGFQHGVCFADTRICAKENLKLPALVLTDFLQYGVRGWTVFGFGHSNSLSGRGFTKVLIPFLVKIVPNLRGLFSKLLFLSAFSRGVWCMQS
jgi:hypothetical protein